MLVYVRTTHAIIAIIVDTYHNNTPTFYSIKCVASGEYSVVAVHATVPSHNHSQAKESMRAMHEDMNRL